MCCGSLGQKMLMSPENLSRVRTKFWDMKMLWRRERRYVAIPNMEVWLRLAHLAPDMPDGWSFADGGRLCSIKLIDIGHPDGPDQEKPHLLICINKSVYATISKDMPRSVSSKLGKLGKLNQLGPS